MFGKGKKKENKASADAPASKNTRGGWYEIRPFTSVEYKDATDLCRLAYNFVFVIAKGADGNAIRMYMKGRSLSASNFEVLPMRNSDALALERSLIHKFNYHLFMRSMLPVAGDAEAFRDRIYEEMALRDIKNTSFIVSASQTFNKRLLSHKLKAERSLEVGSVTMQRMDLRTAKQLITDANIAAKRSQPFFLIDVYISTDERINASHIRDVLPADMARLHIRPTSEKRVTKALARDVVSRKQASLLGYVLYSIGIMAVRDSVWRLHELANVVHLPSKPEMYSIAPGQLPNVSQGFELADVIDETYYEEGQD